MTPCWPGWGHPSAPGGGGEFGRDGRRVPCGSRVGGEIPAPPSASAELINTFEEEDPTGENPPVVGYKVYRDGGVLAAGFRGRGLLEVDAGRGRTEGWFVIDSLDDMALENLLLTALIELFKLHGIHTVHASALEKGGRGILIVAPRGHGKTTSCLSLVRAGYRCLSDDHPLLTESPGGLEIHRFLGRSNASRRTIDFFPELREHHDRTVAGPTGRSGPSTSRRSTDRWEIIRAARLT